MKSIVSSCALVLGLSMLVACTSDDYVEEDKAPGQDSPTAGNNDGPAAVISSDPMAPAPKPRPGMAMIRAIHASANAPAVDAYVKGNPTPVVTGLAYGQTSGWIEVPKGVYEIELRAAPSKASDPIAYVTGALDVPDGAMISAVAAGLLGSTDTDASFRLLPLVERFDMVPGGQALVRAVHAGADAPSVDLDVGNDDPAGPELSGLARFADSGAEGIALPANSALAFGIAKGGSRVTAFTTPKLPAGGQLLVIATGLLGKLPRANDGFALLAVGPNGSVGFIKQDPIVYVLHASPDAPAVDGFVGTAEIFDDLSFGELSKPIQVSPGEYTVDLFGAAAGSARPGGKPAANGNTGMLLAGERYLTAATGLLGNETFQLAGYREGFAQDDSQAVLRAIHSSPDAPAVDIGLVDDAHRISPVVFADLKFVGASAEDGVKVPAGHPLIGVGATGNASPVATFTVPATAGARAFTVAAGLLGGGPDFRLLVVDTAKTPWTASTLFSH